MIKLNYQEALNQAAELEEISQELDRLVKDRLRRELSELQTVWSGEAADLLYRKSEDLFTDISNTANTANRIAGSVRKGAEAVRDAEEAAKKVISVIGL